MKKTGITSKTASPDIEWSVLSLTIRRLSDQPVFSKADQNSIHDFNHRDFHSQVAKAFSGPIVISTVLRRSLMRTTSSNLSAKQQDYLLLAFGLSTAQHECMWPLSNTMQTCCAASKIIPGYSSHDLGSTASCWLSQAAPGCLRTRQTGDVEWVHLIKSH